MAATLTLDHSAQSRKSTAQLVPRNGVLTLFGYGTRVYVDRGHLAIEERHGAEERWTRLPRIGHGLRRLVIIGSDGLISLAALRWLTDQNSAFVMLERNGSVLATTGPVCSSDAKLRRAQALALTNGVGLEISRQIIKAKLEGQERVAREQLRNPAAADAITKFRDRLPLKNTFEEIRVLEAQAAIAYFGAWHGIPILWPKIELKKVPDHWRTVGSRQSPLSGGPRLAVTPVHAILNYCFAVLESESRLALVALGLDPGLGMGLHVDTANRDSLALDVLEPVRPQVEQWVFNWITREPLRRADFFETSTGNCRLMSQLCTKLSETAHVWGKLVAPWAEYVACSIWEKAARSKDRALPTRLTQQRRREAKDQLSLPIVQAPTLERLCRTCGKKIYTGKRYCAQCWIGATRENFDLGRETAQRPESLAKRSATQLKHRQAIRRWRPSDLPTWLTREVYVRRIQPALARIAKSEVQSALGVSEPYSAYIRDGKRVPHPRHWQTLAVLAEVISEAEVTDTHSGQRNYSRQGFHFQNMLQRAGEDR